MGKATYLRFLQLVETLQGDIEKSDLDLTAVRLLEVVAVAHAKESDLTVTEAMALNSIASPATLHRKLTALLDAGYIEFSHKDNNRRTKFVLPTQTANKYFSKLGAALVSVSGVQALQAAQSPNQLP